MDRQSILGYILIFLLLVIWMWVNSPKQTQQAEQSKPVPTLASKQDSVRRLDTLRVQVKETAQTNPLGKFFVGRDKRVDRTFTIETDLYIAEISLKGGLIKRWELKKYKTWDGHPVQLVDYKKAGDLSLLFGTSDGRLINTHDLYFDAALTEPAHRLIGGDEEYTLNLVLPAAGGGQIVKTLRFKNGEYGLGVDIKLVKMTDVVANFEYQLVWESGLRYAEHNSIDESSFAAAYAYAGKELTEINAASLSDRPQKNLSGTVDWVAMRTKYFALAIIAKEGTSDGAYLEGVHTEAPNKGAIESYSVALKMPFKGGQEEGGSLRVLLGPADISLLKS
jgi:YidC/Oxa1 family membrane protein insertase